jgi:hypothetical protein
VVAYGRLGRGGVDDGGWDGACTVGVEGASREAAGRDGLGYVADLGDVFEDVGDAEGADDVDLFLLER